MTLIDKAEALAILAPAPNSKGGLWATRKQALYEQVAALPAVTPTQAREAALREAAAMVETAAMHGGEDAQVLLDARDAILALIGEART